MRERLAAVAAAVVCSCCLPWLFATYPREAAVMAQGARTAGRRPLIGIFGDSLARGAPHGAAWWRYLPPTVEVDNHARSGQTASEALNLLGRQTFLPHGWQPAPYMPPMRYYDAAVIEVGANDALQNLSPLEYASALTRLIRALPAKRKVVVGVLPMLGPGRQEPRGQMDQRAPALYSQIARTVARTEGAVFLDPARAVPQHPAFYRDSVHPNARGARLLAALISKQIARQGE